VASAGCTANLCSLLDGVSSQDDGPFCESGHTCFAFNFR
jgi:hypothetical protein